MPSPATLHRHLEALRAALPSALAQALLQGWLDALRLPGVGQTPEESRLAAGWAMQLRSERGRVIAGLEAALAAAMDAALQARRLLAPVNSAVESLSIAGLTLLDVEQAQSDIEIAHLAARIESDAADAWLALWDRVSRLPFDGSGGLPLDRSHYPAAPEVLARGIGQGVQQCSSSPSQRELLMRLSLGLSADVLAAAYLQGLQTLLEPQEATPQKSSSSNSSDQTDSVTLLHELLRRMAHDPRLNATLQALLMRMEAPLQSLLPKDPSLLSDTHHSAWLFIDELSAHAGELPEDAEHRHQALLQVARGAIEALCAKPDRKRLTQGLIALRTHVALDDEQMAVQAKNSRQALHDAEREREILPLLQQQVGDQLSRSDVKAPRLLRDFLLSNWTEVLARVMAREGSETALAQSLVACVDELLTSLRPSTQEAERQRTAQSLPSLLSRLQQGMDLIALPAPRRQAVLEALMQAHKPLLLPQRGGKKPGSAAGLATESEPPPPIVWDDSDYREQAADNWHAVDTSVGALPTVPMPMDGSTDAQRTARWLQALKPGVRCKLFLQGSWTTARLTWRSDNGQFFMFASNLGSGSHTMTQRALERLRAEGLATEVADGSLLERAMQGWLHDSRPMPL